MLSYSFHHPQEVLLTHFSLHVHKDGLNPIHLILFTMIGAVITNGLNVLLFRNLSKTKVRAHLKYIKL